MPLRKKNMALNKNSDAGEPRKNVYTKDNWREEKRKNRRSFYRANKMFK